MKAPLLASLRTHCAIVAFLFPYIAGWSSGEPDSASTFIGVGGGTGLYGVTSRDCSGNLVSVTRVPFSEGAVTIDHHTGVAHLGARAGIIPEEVARRMFDMGGRFTYDERDDKLERFGPVAYVSPVVGLDTKYFGMDIGGLLPFLGHGLRFKDAVASFGMRIGSKDYFYCSMHFADSAPLLTAGPGIISIGAGGDLGKTGSSLWIGFGIGPYDRPALGARTSIPVMKRTRLQLGATVGLQSFLECGFSTGLQMQF